MWGRGPGFSWPPVRGAVQGLPQESCGGDACLHMPAQRPHWPPLEQNQSFSGGHCSRPHRWGPKWGKWQHLMGETLLVRGLRTLPQLLASRVAKGRVWGHEDPAVLREEGWTDAWGVSGSSPGGHPLHQGSRSGLGAEQQPTALGDAPSPGRGPRAGFSGMGWARWSDNSLWSSSNPN